MVKAFKQEIPGEWLDLYRKVFGEPVMAGVSYKWGRDYGYEGYQIGTHVPEVQPPVQGVVGMKISAARKSARLFLMSVATVWGFQTDTGTATFAYSGACDQEWWDEFFLDVAGNKWQKFVGATWGPLGDYGFVLWGDPAPPVGWNVIDSGNGDVVSERDPWGFQIRILMDTADDLWYWDGLILCAGSRRLFMVWPGYGAINLNFDTLELVVEKTAAGWVPGAVTWNNAPGSWTEVDRFVPDVLGGSRTIYTDAGCSYRIRWEVENASRPTPGAEGFVLMNDVTLYGHA